MDYQQMIESMTPDIYQSLKRSVELGKWPDGKTLTREQRESALQAIITWGETYLTEGERVGFIQKKEKEGEHCDSPLETPLNWIDEEQQ